MEGFQAGEFLPVWILLVLLAVTVIILGLRAGARAVKGALVTGCILALILFLALFFRDGNGLQRLRSLFGETPPAVTRILPKEREPVSTRLKDYQVEPLSPDSPSDTEEGAVRYGAVIRLGELDEYGRSAWAHIRLSEDQEPGNNGEERDEYIYVDPAGWKNFEINGNWANNRCHLIGYQFSGLNDELRNLSIGTSYLNKGTEGAGTEEGNPDGMLYYEQKLDQWLSDHPEGELDLYVRPVYEGDNFMPTYYYMQWTGFDAEGNTMPIDLGGKSEVFDEVTGGVLLLNQSPSYAIDYETGDVTGK